MYLTRKELVFAYENLPDSELRDKIALEIFIDEEVVELIKKSFKNLHSIYKCDNANKYCAKFYEEEEDDEFRCSIATGIETENNPDVEVDFIEIDKDKKGTVDDWMYSSYDLIWTSENND